MLRWSFEYMQRPAPEGGAIYLRLSTRSIAQPLRQLSAADAEAMVAGAYWVRRPGPNAEAVIAYTGAVAPESVPRSIRPSSWILPAARMRKHAAVGQPDDTLEVV